VVLEVYHRSQEWPVVLEVFTSGWWGWRRTSWWGGGGVPHWRQPYQQWLLMLPRCSAKLVRLLVSYRIRLLVGIRGHRSHYSIAFLIAEASLNIDTHDFIATIE